MRVLSFLISALQFLITLKCIVRYASLHRCTNGTSRGRVLVAWRQRARRRSAVKERNPSQAGRQAGRRHCTPHQGAR
jgi:hypothetical protein